MSTGGACKASSVNQKMFTLESNQLMMSDLVGQTLHRFRVGGEARHSVDHHPLPAPLHLIFDLHTLRLARGDPVTARVGFHPKFQHHR